MLFLIPIFMIFFVVVTYSQRNTDKGLIFCFCMAIFGVFYFILLLFGLMTLFMPVYFTTDNPEHSEFFDILVTTTFIFSVIAAFLLTIKMLKGKKTIKNKQEENQSNESGANNEEIADVKDEDGNRKS